MKKYSSLVIAAMLFSTALFAQPGPNATASSGQVTLADNSTVSGIIKDNIQKKGEVTVEANGKKTKYGAGEISGVQFGTTKFITQNYTFYEVITEGKNFTLFRKANDPSGIQYSGNDPIAISSEGDVDDLFVKKSGTNILQLITKKNVKEVLGACANGYDATKFDVESVSNLLKSCN